MDILYKKEKRIVLKACHMSWNIGYEVVELLWNIGYEVLIKEKKEIL